MFFQGPIKHGVYLFSFEGLQSEVRALAHNTLYHCVLWDIIFEIKFIMFGIKISLYNNNNLIKLIKNVMLALLK